MPSSREPEMLRRARRICRPPRFPFHPFAVPPALRTENYGLRGLPRLNYPAIN
jgi:hypothetical protein